MKAASCLIALSLVVFAYSVYAVPHQVGAFPSPTRSFSLNGRWFSVGKPSRTGTIVRGELAKRGFDVSRILREPGNPDEPFIDTLMELPPGNIRSRFSSVPVPLRDKITLQTVSDAGTVDITFGNGISGGNHTRKELLAKGWRIVETGKSASPGFIATIRNGRETSVVFLEEKTGGFLSIRRLEK